MTKHKESNKHILPRCATFIMISGLHVQHCMHGVDNHDTRDYAITYYTVIMKCMTVVLQVLCLHMSMNLYSLLAT